MKMLPLLQSFKLTRSVFGLILLASCLAVPSALLAANHALLIGVGSYPLLGPRLQLEGPRHDVLALQQMLLERFGFGPDRVVTLLDEQAGRSSILSALDELAGRVEPGDFVLVYFGGHGTSANDRGFKISISPTTGALVPADFEVSRNQQEMLRRLIIGTRDLRPRIAVLEKKATVLVCVDACHSGYSVRGSAVEPEAQSRYLDFWDSAGVVVPEFRDAGLPGVIPYPYRNTIYLAASSAYESAYDINSRLLRKGRSTYDGKPHGAFTDALLRGLDGLADGDYDQKLTIGELYGYVRNQVTMIYPQTPQLLKPEAHGLDTVIFSGSSSGGVVTTPVAGPVAPDSGVAVEVFSQPGSRPQPTQVAAKAEPAESRQEPPLVAAARKLAGSGLNLELEPLGAVLLEGQILSLQLELDEPRYLVILSVDPRGGVHLIHPWRRSELAAVTGSLRLPEIGRISGPDFGREYLLAFGYSQRPRFLDSFLAQLEAGEGSGALDRQPRDKILASLQDGTEPAASVLPVTTCRPGDFQATAAPSSP